MIFFPHKIKHNDNRKINTSENIKAEIIKKTNKKTVHL